MKLAEVVVDPEREAHPLDGDPELRRSGRAQGPPKRGVGHRDRAGVDRLGADDDPVGGRLPGAGEHRATLDMQEAGGDSAVNPHHPILAAAARHPEG